MLFAIQDMGVCENCGHVALLTLPNYWFQVVKTDGFCDFGKNKWSSPIIIHNHRYWAILRWGLWMLTIPYIPIWSSWLIHVNPIRLMVHVFFPESSPQPGWAARPMRWSCTAVRWEVCLGTRRNLQNMVIFRTFFGVMLWCFYGDFICFHEIYIWWCYVFLVIWWWV